MRAKEESINMSMNSIRKLNSGGLKLKSNFSAKTVARNITSNKSDATTMLQSSNYAGSGNALFTKSNPMGRQPKYMSSGQLSSWANRGRGQNLSYGGPVTSGSVVYTQQVSGSDSSNSFAQFLGTALGLAPLAFQMFGSSSSSSSGAAANAASRQTTQNNSRSVGDNLLNQANLSNTTISTGANDVQGLLNNMRMAGSQDSVTLRNAIAEANGKLSEMQAQTPDIQAEAQYADNTLKPEAAQMVTDAGKEVDQAKGAVSDANASVKGAELGVDKAKSTLTQAIKDKGIKNDKYIEARSNLSIAKQNKADATQKHTQATQATTTAKQELSNAEQTLNNTPKTKDDGNGHQVPNEPAYSNAQRAVEQAKLKLQQAEQRESEAKKAEEKAIAAEEKAVQAESQAKELLSDAEKEVVADENAFKKEEEGLKTAQKGLNTAKTNQQQATDQLELAQAKEKSVQEYAKKISDTAGKLQTHLKDVQELQNGINEANKQLQKLQDKEATEKRDVDNQMGKNDKRNAKLDKKHDFFDDKTSKKEMKAWNERTANQAQNQRLGQQSQRLGSNIQQSTDYTNLASGSYAGKTEFTASGHTYTADESKGIYLRDGIPTTQADYDNAKLAYHAQQKQV